MHVTVFIPKVSNRPSDAPDDVPAGAGLISAQDVHGMCETAFGNRTEDDLMKNTLFVLLDGAEDDPIPEFGGKKPLEVANMPFLRSKGRHKLYTTGRGYTHLFLNEFFTGHPPDLSRGALEAHGFGLKTGEGRVAYRMTPARLRDGMVRWAYDSDGFADEIEACVRKHLDLLDDPDIRFYMGGKAVLTFKGDAVPVPMPPEDAPIVDIPGQLGDIVDAVARDMDGITDYPWGEGPACEQDFKAFPCIRNLTAISNGPVALGICSSLGQKTMLIDDLEERFPAARKALEEGDVFLHLDEVDEYSHQKDAPKKVRVLEKIDRLMERYFSDVDNIIWFVDHGTSCVTGNHILMTVPFWTSIDSDWADGDMVPLKDLIPSIVK